MSQEALEKKEVVKFPGKEDLNKKTIEKIESFTDYGEPSLDNIGKSNPFAPIE